VTARRRRRAGQANGQATQFAVRAAISDQLANVDIAPPTLMGSTVGESLGLDGKAAFTASKVGTPAIDRAVDPCDVKNCLLFDSDDCVSD